MPRVERYTHRPDLASECQDNASRKTTVRTNYICPFLWRPLGTPLLFNWCWCVHPMKAGAAGQDDTAPRATGRSDGRDREVWMGCRASLTAAVLNVRRMGMRCGRAPQIAIPPIRPATPRTPAALSLPLLAQPDLTHVTVQSLARPNSQLELYYWAAWAAAVSAVRRVCRPAAFSSCTLQARFIPACPQTPRCPRSFLSFLPATLSESSPCNAGRQ